MNVRRALGNQKKKFMYGHWGNNPQEILKFHIYTSADIYNSFKFLNENFQGGGWWGGLLQMPNVRPGNDLTLIIIHLFCKNIQNLLIHINYKQSYEMASRYFFIFLC